LSGPSPGFFFAVAAFAFAVAGAFAFLAPRDVRYMAVIFAARGVWGVFDGVRARRRWNQAGARDDA
jgi:hypothetical protein